MRTGFGMGGGSPLRFDVPVRLRLRAHIFIPPSPLQEVAAAPPAGTPQPAALTPVVVTAAHAAWSAVTT